ncbi:MAG: transporter substrate-binding protein [Frankiales bacterium]|nr:transporter substrate-binding protein [Frankiales bacterium]
MSVSHTYSVGRGSTAESETLRNTGHDEGVRVLQPRARAMVIANATVLVAALLSVGQVRYELDQGATLSQRDSGIGFTEPTPSASRPPAAQPGRPGARPSVGPTGPGTQVPGGTGTTGPGGGSGGSGGAVGAPAQPLVTVPDFGLRTQGVTPTSVLIGADYDKTGCGGAGALASQFGAAVTGDPEKAFAAFVRHVNETGGIRGRTLKFVSVDDGGLYCPERHQAAALELVDQKKVFLDIAGLHEVSDLLAPRRLPFYGGRATIAEQNKQGDGQFQLYQDADGDFANWAAFGRNYLGSKTNTPCLIHPDTPDFNNLEKVLKRALAKQGLAFKTTIAYADDPSTAQQQATTAAIKMKGDGCKQVWLIANNFLADVFFTNAADQQRWYPTWTWTARTGGIDFALAGNLMNQNQWKNAVGLTTRIKPGQSPLDGQCARIYNKYYGGDGQSGSAAVTVACHSILTTTEAMKRAIDRTGVLTGNSLMLGVDAIRGDFAWEAFVPLTYSVPAPGKARDRTGYDLQTVATWNTDKRDYDFPQYPKYWRVLGPGGAGAVDIRPSFKNTYAPPKK